MRPPVFADLILVVPDVNKATPDEVIYLSYMALDRERQTIPDESRGHR